MNCMYYLPYAYPITLRTPLVWKIFECFLMMQTNADYFNPRKKQIPMLNFDLYGETKLTVPSRGSMNSPANLYCRHVARKFDFQPVSETKCTSVSSELFLKCIINVYRPSLSLDLNKSNNTYTFNTIKILLRTQNAFIAVITI